MAIRRFSVSLNRIVDIDMLGGETPRRVQEIWNTYHARLPDYISTVLSVHQFDEFLNRIET